MRIKAVLFDMDGIIIDSEPIHRKAYYKMFDEVGINVSESMYEGFTGQSTINICNTLCTHFQLEEQAETLMALKRKYFYDIFDNDPSISLLDGVLDLIKNYTSHGLKLVLASSASRQNIDAVFHRFKLEPYFLGKVSGAELKASKPHPEIFEKAAELSGVPRKQCIVIEDATNGILAAKRAGIYCIAYKSENSKNQDYSQADLVIDNFETIIYEKLDKIM